MRSTTGKLALSLASAAIAAAALYPLYRELTKQEVIDFYPDEGALEATAGGAPVAWEEPPPPADDMPGVLGVERPLFPPSAFVRKPITLQRFADNDKSAEADPFVNYRYKPNLELRRPWNEHPDGVWFQRTNALGMREDEQVAAERPDLRILIAGDSHTDGVCNNSEAFGNLVEARLEREYPERAIESLNAGRGGYSFYQYLGTLERFLYLQPDVFVVGVYGGNDFETVLTLFHEYNGTQRPPGQELYGKLVEQALAINQVCLAQSFLSLKYFDVHPEQMEVALQAARDITTEILVACLRHSVHPIFVYIPAMPDVEWASETEVFDRIAEVLEISPSGLRTTDVMADSYIAFLRELRVDVIDLRETFGRAGPGNFWLADQHINLRAQRSIADELYPLVVAARPLDALRTRRAPVSQGPVDPLAFLAPGNALEQTLSEPPLRIALPQPREFDEQAVAALSAGRSLVVHDALAGYRYEARLEVPSAEVGLAGRSFPFVTNGQGLREDQDVAGAADLRVVVTGDDHVAGICVNPETFGNLAEAELCRRHPGHSIEILNAGVAGYTFQNYLGVLQRSLALRPDVFVVVVSTGSDFMEGLRVDGYLNEIALEPRSDKYADLLDAARAISPSAVAQFFGSVNHFRKHRLRSHRAFQVGLDALLEVRRICGENGIELIVLHLPAAADVEWERHAGTLERVRAALEIEQQQVDANAILARGFFRELQRYGIQTLALDELLAARAEPLYDPDNFLIDAAAHGLIATLLVERLERLAAALD